MTATRPPINETSDNPQKGEDKASEAKKFSKFNDLSVALSFAIICLVIVYLPDVIDKSIDWKAEGRIIGVITSVVGVACALLVASKLTDREGFSNWGIAILIGGAVGWPMIILHKHDLPAWVTITLTVWIIGLAFVGIYALVSGFASFFDEPTAKANPAATALDSEYGLPTSTETKERKELSGYERITLLIAVLSALATVAAAVEPIVHPLCALSVFGCLRVPRLTWCVAHRLRLMCDTP